MDSQHRHELETNSLAKALVETGEKVAPYRQTIVIGGIAAIALAVIAGMAMRGGDKHSDGWQSYAAAAERQEPDLDALLSTADVYAGTPVSELSRIMWADARLLEAMQQYFTNKQLANDALVEAKAAYEQLRKANNKTIVERAEFGLARVAEANGEANEALEAYKAIDSGPFASAAAARVRALEEKAADGQLEWLVTAQAISSGLPAGLEQSMDFGADDIELPDAGPTSQEAFSDLLNSLPQLPLREKEPAQPPTDGVDPSATKAMESNAAEPATTDEETPDAESTETESTVDDDAEMTEDAGPGVDETKPAADPAPAAEEATEEPASSDE